MDLEGTLKASIGDRYDIERRLGAGAMAEVFLAFDRKHNRRVAVKVLKPELGSAIGADRFQREIEVLAGLTHPHILPLHDSGQADALLYFVTPWIEGESLRNRLEREGRLPVRDAVRIAREIAGALGYAHRRGIVHRDVKPANILLTGEHALLADFGVAHLAQPEDARLTGTGLALGTPAYFSPEQAAGDENIDGRSDIYSLGCVLFEMLTGQPPFAEDSIRALITRHIVDAPPMIRSRRDDVSEGVEAVVQTALQKEPERRFQTAEEMAGSLDMMSGGFEAMAAAALRKLLPPKPRWLHGRRLAAAIAAGAILLVAGALTLRSLIEGETYRSADATYYLSPEPSVGSTAREDSLARRAVALLYFQLSSWSEIRVVDRNSLGGPAADLQLAGIGLAPQSVDEAEALAQRTRATHIVRLRVLATGDSVSLVAKISERRIGAESEESYQYEGTQERLDLVTASLALDILELHGEPAEFGDIVERSRVLTAQQEFEEGQLALYDWRLARAEAHFRAALQEDPEFALAHYFLAQTLYWRTARDRQRLHDLGPEIERHATRAVRYGSAERLRPLERSRIAGFRAFWAGRYTEARATYDSLLRFNPTDVEALLLRGSVEYEDPWLIEARRGDLVPRKDLALARAMFDSAAYLKPEWELSLGRLGDIGWDVVRAVHFGWCYGYQPPPIEPQPPYVIREAVEQEYFCPMIEDGDVTWFADSMPASREEEARRAAQDLLDRTVDRLERIAAVEADQARPHEELVRWLLWEHSARGCATGPEQAERLLSEARDHLEQALAIRGDTTPEDRARLATVLMATGNTPDAVSQADRALSGLGDWRDDDGPLPPIEVANVYLAAGQPALASLIVQRSQSDVNWSVPDPAYPDSAYEGGEGVYGALFALRTLGFAGVSDARADSLFQSVERSWDEVGLSARGRAVVRADAARSATTALALRPDLWDAWLGGLEEQGLELPAIWKGLLAAGEDPGLAREYLDEAIAEIDDGPPGRVRPSDYYMPILLASRLGEDSLATGLMERAEACPKRVETLDLAWAMRPLPAEAGPSD